MTADNDRGQQGQVAPLPTGANRSEPMPDARRESPNRMHRPSSFFFAKTESGWLPFLGQVPLYGRGIRVSTS